MKKPDSPCYKCADRTPGCHGSCGRYAEYKQHHCRYASAVQAEKNMKGWLRDERPLHS